MQSITYFNPLQPTETKSEICNYKNTSDIRKEFQFDAIAYELVIAKNNEIIIEDCEILDNDVVSVMVKPRGGGGGGAKDIIKVVAMIAVVVAAPYLAGAMTYGMAAAGFGTMAGMMSTAIGFSLVTAGIVMAGGMLINAVLPPNVPDIPTTDLATTSQTYSWSEASNQIVQGDAMPRLFGTFRIAPRLISKYVESIDDKQYLNLLYLVNDGQISSISDIKINDEVINNFAYVSYETRMGQINQSLIKSFDDIIVDKNVAKKISTSWSESNTDGDTATSIAMTVVFPRGLFYANDSGGLSDYSVTLIPQYSADNVNWYDMNIASYSPYYYWNGSSYTIYNAFGTSSTILGYTNTLPSGVFYLPNMVHINEIPAKFGTLIEASLVDMYNGWYAMPVYGSSGQSITITRATSSSFRQTFRISNLPPAQYYMRVRFASAPETTSRYASDCYFEYLTESTSYDFTYPGCALLAVRALATDQLSGGMPTVTCKVTAGSSNPAVIVKTILTECGISEDRFSSNFDAWETYCDDNGLECHIYFDAITDVRQAINYVSTLGRASVLQFGSKFDVIIDKAEIIPTQGFTFGMGNILKDTFKQTFLPLKDRANIVEVSYYDIENEYQKTAIEIASEDYDTVLEANKSSVNLIGCVSRTKAIEHAKLLLNSNRYLTQTFTFQADIDSLVCKVGDIVRISHDVPQYGFSGRLVSATTTGVVLDREITFEEGKSYYLQARRNTTNEIIEVEVSNTENTTNSITFITAMTTALSALDNYSFGEINKVDAKARVLNIRTTSEFLREITCVEYNESVYDLDHEPVVFDISSIGLSNLRINDYIQYDKNGNIETVVNIAWSGNSLYYDVTVNNKTIRVYEQFANFFGLIDNTTYTISIKDTYGNTISDNYTVIGKLEKPAAVTNASYSINCDYVTLQWEYEDKPIDFKEFVIKIDETIITTTSTTSVQIPLTKQINNYSIFATDTSNIYSDAIFVSFTVPYLQDVSGFTTYWSKAGEIETNWQFISASCAPILYEIRKGSSWAASQVVCETYDKFYKPTGSGDYYIKAKHLNIFGFANYSENASSIDISGDIFTNNVIAEFDEKATNWSGILSNLITYNDEIFGNVIALAPMTSDVDTLSNFDAISNVDYISGFYSSGIYELSNTVTLDETNRCGINIDFDLYGIDLTSNVDLIDDFDLVVNIDGDYGQYINAIPQISIDGGDWVNFNNGDWVAQTFNFRLLITSNNPNIVTVVNNLKITVDVPDRFEQGSNLLISSLGNTIVYAKPFNTDITNIQVTILNASDGDYCIITNDDRNGFDIEIKNGLTNVSKYLNWFTQAY